MNLSRSELAPEGLLHQDYFALFGLPLGYTLDLGALEAGWKRLQRAAHPDRFARADDAQKRLALQWSTRINEAYAVLKDPVQRAAYLCGLLGLQVDAQSSAQLPQEFLETQMLLREEHAELQDLPDTPARLQAVERLRTLCAGQMAEGSARLASLLDGLPADRGEALSRISMERLQKAAMQVRALMFVKKFQMELG